MSVKRVYRGTNSLSSTEKWQRNAISFWLGGYGCRKKHYWAPVSSTTQYEFYDSDQEIEKRTGADVERVFDVEGEDGFRNREKVINELTEKQGIVLATGGGSVKSRETHGTVSPRVA